MPMRLIPSEVLDDAMARIRGGETFTAVIASLHLDAGRLRYQLQHTYDDFTPIMQANRRHQQPQLMPKHVTGVKSLGRAKLALAAKGHGGSRPKLNLPLSAVEQQRRADFAGHVAILRREKRLRMLEDFDEQELGALTAKVLEYQRSHAGLESSAPPPSVIRQF